MNFTDIRFHSALIAAKVSAFVLKNVCKSNATSMPGKVIFKTYPEFLRYAMKYCNKKTVTVTGTNGKTTTSGMIAKILSTDGSSVINNAQGANMLTGIAAAVGADLNCKTGVDYFVFESDEAYLTKLYDFISPDTLVVTNLFRDQLDRYGELATTASKIKHAINKHPGINLILNADDPMLLELPINNDNVTWFGFDKIDMLCDVPSEVNATDNTTCKCGREFSYSQRFYSHIGHYHCSCGIKRPNTKYKAFAKIYVDRSEIQVLTPSNKSIDFSVPVPNIYNAYNALAAINMGLEYNISPENIQTALNAYKPIFGRSETKTVNGREILIQLIKNPTGATEVLKTVTAYKNAVLMIAINDNYADGRDVSWLWDTEFEILRTFSGKIIISGIRALDMALRLKYAGIPQEQMIIEEKLQDAVNIALNEASGADKLLIMPTYTALLKLDKIL